VIELRAVLHQEALHAGELIGLRRKYDNVEFNIGKILTGKFKGTEIVGILGVNDPREFVWHALLERLDRFSVFFGLTRCVVVGGHCGARSLSSGGGNVRR
jgi:hypothetical protein